MFGGGCRPSATAASASTRSPMYGRRMSGVYLVRAIDSRAEVPMSENKPVSVKLTIDEATAQGHYVNFANILHNPTEFVLDFGRVVPGRADAKILARILTTPYHAKQLS